MGDISDLAAFVGEWTVKARFPEGPPGGGARRGSRGPQRKTATEMNYVRVG